MTESPSTDRFVRSSPFVDGYRIERHPIAMMSDEPFDEAREQERFDRIVTCIDVSPNRYSHQREWQFSEALFIGVPSAETAKWWWDKLEPDAEDMAPLPADILAPLLAGRESIDFALTAANQRFSDYLARRALIPLASPELQEEWRALSIKPLPTELTLKPQYKHWLSEVASVLNPDFVRSAVVRGLDDEVCQRVRAFLGSDLEDTCPGDWLRYDAAMTVCLLPVSERIEAWPLSYASSLPIGAYYSDLSPLAATAPQLLYDITRKLYGSLEASTVATRRALPLRHGPSSAAAWLSSLRSSGSAPALIWLRDHPYDLLAADIPPENFDDLYLVLAGLSSELLMTARGVAHVGVESVIDEVLADRSTQPMHDPGAWWREAIPAPPKRRKNFTGLGLETLPPFLVDERVLTPDLIDVLLQSLAIGALNDEVLAKMSEHLDTVNCDRFAMSLFLLWVHHDTPVKSAWMLSESAVFGGDQFAAAVITQMDQWYWDGQHAKSLKGIQALGRTNSDVALSYLLDLAASGPSSSARRREATAQLSGIAQRRGMNVNRLEDRMLVDVAKPPVKRQKTRFLHAMVAGENWPFEDFTTYVIGHPALKELTAGLIWGVYSGPEPDAVLRISFIVDDEGRALDVDDAVVEIAADENIRVIHPSQLSEDEREAWLQVLADDELVPPFDQLARPVFTLTPPETEATSLAVVHTKDVAPKRLNGILIKHGWERGRAGSGGYISVMTLPVASAGCTVVMVLSEPGLHAMPSMDSTKIRVSELFATSSVVPMGTLSAERDEVHALPREPWSIVPPTVISEVLATIAAL